MQSEETQRKHTETILMSTTFIKLVLKYILLLLMSCRYDKLLIKKKLNQSIYTFIGWNRYPASRSAQFALGPAHGIMRKINLRLQASHK